VIEGEGCVYCLLASLLLFVLLGLLLSVFYGAVVVNAVMSRHLHVLRKYTEAKDKTVRDLMRNDDDKEKEEMDDDEDDDDDGGGDIELGTNTYLLAQN
jgi:hypothetical protein